LNLPFFIAKRYLISKKSHNAINIISGISIAGICIGTMALVIVLSAFNGLSDLVQTLYKSFDADIQITAQQGKTFDPNTSQFQELKKVKGLAFYTEIVEGNALLKLNEKQTIATIKGVSTDFVKMNRFDTLVFDGNYSVDKNNIVLGRGLSYILDANVNSLVAPISVYAPKRGDVNSINPEDGLNELKVYPAGLFAINDEFDNKYVLMNIQNARALFDYTTEVTAIELSVDKTADKAEVQKNIQSILGDGFNVKNREEQNALLYKTLKSEKVWTFIILAFILIIATLNVIGSLTMLVIEKKKDIATLHKMGADTSLIRKIFLMEGVLITLVGLVLGLVLGIVVCWLQTNFSILEFSEGYVVSAYPIQIRFLDILSISAVVMLIGFVATWYPVRLFTNKYMIQ
jgi:lipoprotein-releasing system permease protein